MSTPTPTPTSSTVETKAPVMSIADTTIIELSNGVKIHKPLNLHAAWAKISNIKLGLGMMGISNLDIVCTLCIKDISNICPEFKMPDVSLPQDIFAIDANMDVLRQAYAKYATVFCNIPMVDWKLIKQEITPYLDLSAL